MEQKYLHQVLPFMNELSKMRREKLEDYFMSAPVWLMDSFQIVHMKKDVTFIREQAPADMIYVIGKGTIKAMDYRIIGTSYDFMRFEGMYAMGGMEVVMDLDTYMTTLKTVTPCIMITIPRKQFEKWLKTDIKALKQEAKVIGEYLLDQGRKGRVFLFLQGADRLCLLFTEMYRYQSKTDVFELAISRQELAEQTGMCVKTINRAVKKLEEQELISRRGNKIIITKEQYHKMDKKVSNMIDQ